MSEEAKNSTIAVIDAADDFRDPLEALLKATETDPGAPFALDILAHLAALGIHLLAFAIAALLAAPTIASAQWLGLH